jgi:hypothetical protein
MTIIAIGAALIVLAAFAVLPFRTTEHSRRRQAAARAMSEALAQRYQVPPTRRNWLVGVTGPVAGQWFLVGDRTMTVGRSAQNFVQVEVPDVSRRHCQLRVENGALRVVDLRSRTGVFVNGERVRTGALRDGDKLEIGGVSFLFQIEGAAEDATARRKHACLETEAFETRLSPPAAT